MAKAKVTTKVIGDTELLRKLRQLDAEMAGDTLEKAVTEGAKLVKDDASRRAPRRTGKLARSIIVETVEKEQGRAAVGVGPNKDAFYGMFVELGTVKMKAQPFLFPAYEANKKDVTKTIRDELRKVIERTVR